LRRIKEKTAQLLLHEFAGRTDLMPFVKATKKGLAAADAA
jgi:hypothetical protein